MPRLYSSRKTFGANRKVAAAKKAVARASRVLGSTSAMDIAPPSTRGFFGALNRRGNRSSRPELKYVDLAGTNVGTTATWSVVLLNGLALGTDITARIGRKCCMKSILFRINHFNSLTASANYSNGISGRCALVYDAQPNSGSTPSGLTIFVANTPQTPNNLDNRDRFKIIADWTWQINAFVLTAGSALSTGNPQNVPRVIYRRLNHDMIFSGVGATQGDISTGAMYLVYISDAAGGAQLDFHSRIRFTDN